VGKKNFKKQYLNFNNKMGKKKKTNKPTKPTKHAVGTVPRFTRILLKVF
jgi:hypothetical protein